MLKNLASNIISTLNKQQPALRAVSVRFQSTDYPAKCEGILFELKKQVLWIKLDRPKKLNALTKEMYDNINDNLEKVNGDQSIKAVVLTGNGDFYSSGNDLSNFARAMQDEEGPRAGLTKSADILYKFVNSIINLEKLFIAAVNGPAFGITVTTLPLFDYVLASDKATFESPFTSLGQCPEACSSITFPEIMGQTRASELLLLNMKWDSKKAQSYGLVSDIVPHDKFYEHLDAFLYGKHGIVESCYPNSLKVSKSLTRDPSRKHKLIEANRRECDAILELWLGEECADAIQKFFKRNRK